MQSWSVQEAQDSELLSVWSSKDSKLPAFPSCSPLALTPSPHKEASTLLSETCTKTTGAGMLTILSKEATGLETKMPFITCANKHLMPSMNFSPTVFLSQGPKKAKSTKELSEASPSNTAKVTKD